jgi:hypothetical protein
MQFVRKTHFSPEAPAQRQRRRREQVAIHPQSTVLGEGASSAASDGTKFESWQQNLMTQWRSRCKGYGVMVCWPVETNAVCILSSSSCRPVAMGVFVQYDKSIMVLKLAGARARKRAQEGRWKRPEAVRILSWRGRGPGAHPGSQERGFRVRAHRHAPQRGGRFLEDGLALARVCRQTDPDWPRSRNEACASS